MTAKDRKQFAQAAAACQEQSVSLDGPGTILRDFQAAVQLLANGVPLKGKSDTFPQEILPALNAAMCDPMQVPLKRPLMKDYPNISGIYVLLRALGFLKVERKKLSLDPVQLAGWNKLNPTEQYFSLLRGWLLWAHPRMVGGGKTYREPEPDLLAFLVPLSTWPTDTWETIFRLSRNSSRGAIDSWRFQLASRFGLAEVREDPRWQFSVSPTWHLGMMKATPWGQTVSRTFVRALAASDPGGRIQPDWILELPTNVESIFLEGFKACRPELKRLLSRPKVAVTTTDFVFKVTINGYPGVWRRIFCRSNTSLAEVASHVLSAFKFDEDHLYEFAYRDSSGADRIYLHPGCEEGTPANEITLGEAGLPERPVLNFHFDFGDDWRFTLRGEKPKSPGRKPKNGAVVAKEGKAPEQYPNWE